VNLTQLWLGKNKITSLEGLDLPQLELLSIQSNRITSMKGLEKCVGLKEVNLQFLNL
jgi:protein phosphatase 1 regulatory subunit 7